MVGNVANGGVLRRQKRQLSRLSTFKALKAYTSNQALNCPTFDVVKETKKYGFLRRQKR